MTNNYFIGITTTPIRLKQTLQRDMRSPVEPFISCDKEFNGVAWNRNQVIAAFMESQKKYLFLFDDDTYPIMDGWAEYFIQMHEQSDIQHFNLPESFKSDLINVWEGMGFYSSLIGSFHFITRDLITEIGGFNPAYHKYGYEDVGFRNRAKRAQIIPDNQNASPLRAAYYIFSEDVYARNPTPNYSHAEKMGFIAKNHSILQEELTSKQLYYPYN